MSELRTHQVRPGDSLQKIARIYEIDYWQEVAELNQLQAPYIDSSFPVPETKEKDVKYVGEHLIVPSTFHSVQSLKDVTEVERLAYGQDLSLYPDQLAIHHEKGTLTEGTDLQRVEGLKNLSQQLLTSLSVNKGDLLLHPEFGSDLYLMVGLKDNLATRNKIRFEIERVIRSDFRVAGVKDIEVQSINGNYQVTATVVPRPPGSPFDFKYIVTKRGG